ncbi:MAG: hypothetical protein EAZ99_09690 [Alphaproteobacteria bacterium]|nr:MAG: hypothetical protein EAZ99_09690 [Alphaproteobacteria bacterium]
MTGTPEVLEPDPVIPEDTSSITPDTFTNLFGGGATEPGDGETSSPGPITFLPFSGDSGGEPVSGGSDTFDVIQVTTGGSFNSSSINELVDAIILTGSVPGSLDFEERVSPLTLVTGTGTDSITGGSGGDSVSSGAGSDSAVGGGGGDVIDGGSGDDVVAGGDSVTTYFNTQTLTLDGITSPSLNPDEQRVVISAFADSLKVDGISVTFVSTINSGGGSSIGNSVAPASASSTTVPSWFDASWYSSVNTDVARAITARTVTSAFEHFLAVGQREGRSPNASFDPTAYLQANPDVAAAVRTGLFTSGFEHFLLFGAAEGRRPSARFSAQDYLDAHPDVARAVSLGTITAGQHAVLFGGRERRGLDDRDSLLGGSGNDLIDGGRGRDTINGGSGADTIIGGQHNDSLTGGTGGDRFRFEAGSGADTITDFSATQGDRIDVVSRPSAPLTGFSVASDAAGNAVVVLSSGDTITLIGVRASQVTADMFNILSASG